MQIRSKLVVSLVSMVATLACGDDGGSDVSGNKAVSELSPSEAKAVCNELTPQIENAVGSFVKVTCTFAGLLTGSRDTCEASVKKCVDNAAANANDNGVDCQEGPPAGCDDATVQELRDCIDANVAAAEKVSEKITCSTSASALTDPSQFAPQMPAACTKLGTKCAGALGQSGTTD